MSVPGANRAVIALEDVSKVFGSNAHATVAVHQATLHASAGELLLLLGPSGSGKTTLLMLMAGLIRPTSGEVTLFGSRIQDYTEKQLQSLRARRVGFIFQTFLLVDSLTVRENVEVVLRFSDHPPAEGRKTALRLLDRFEVGQLAPRFPSQLSQGEKQRVAIARAMANDAALIIADEPTGSLETRQGMNVIEVLHGLARENGRCVVVASHDLRLARLADRVIRLKDGRISSP